MKLLNKICTLLLILILLEVTSFSQLPQLVLPVGHLYGDINSAEFSASQKFVITGSDDKTAIVWDFESGRRLYSLVGHEDRVINAFFTNNDNLIMTISADGTAIAWEPLTGKKKYQIDHISNDYPPQLSPDEKRICFIDSSNNYSTAIIYDLVSGSILTKLEDVSNELQSIAFSADSRRLAVSGEYENFIWDIEDSKKIIVLDDTDLFVNCIRFSEDGNLLEGGTKEGQIIIWDLKTAKILRTIRIGAVDKNEKNIKAIFSNRETNEKLLVTKDMRVIHCSAAYEYLFASKANSFNYQIIPNPLSPQGRLFSNVTKDGSEIKILSLSDNKEKFKIQKSADNSITAFDWSPDGKFVAIATGLEVEIREIATGKLERVLKGKQMSITGSAGFSKDGRYCAMAYNANSNINFNVIEISNGHIIESFKLPTAFLKSTNEEIISSKSSFTFRKSARVGEKGYVIDAELWNKKTGKLIGKLIGHSNIISTAQFTKDEKFIVTSSWDKTIIIWRTSNGAIYKKLNSHTGIVNSAVLSNDDKFILSASADSTAVIWDVVSGSLLKKIKMDGPCLVAAFIDVPREKGNKDIAIFTKNKMRLYSKENLNEEFLLSFDPFQSEIENINNSFSKIALKNKDYGQGKLGVILQLTNPNSGIHLRGHTDEITLMTWSPNDKKLVTASKDSSLIVWDTETGQILHQFKFSAIVEQAKFSPNGEFLLTYVRLIDSGWKKDVHPIEDNVVLWSTSSWEKIATINNPFPRGAEDKIYFSRNSKYLYHFQKGTSHLYSVSNVANKISVPGLVCGFSNNDENLISTNQSYFQVYQLPPLKLLYNFVSLDSSNYLVIDSFGRFDGTETATKLLYFSCGTEIIALDQIKDQLWVPNLATLISGGERINAPKLTEKNICGLIPSIQRIRNELHGYHFKITPRAGGLGETVLSVNGNEIRRYKPVDLQKTEDGYELYVSKEDLEANFVEGTENPITVKAFTLSNDISSRGVTILKKQESKAVSYPNLYAVMVGINDYKGDDLDLRYAAKDAKNLLSAVEVAAKKMLNVDGKNHVFMYDLTTDKDHYLQPEKNSIKEVLQHIGKTATANDILLIFFAGHGVMYGDDKKQFYFLTADASKASSIGSTVADVGISTNELTEWIKPANIKAQKRILILDACNSGQAIDDAVKIGQGRNEDKIQQIKSIDKLNERSGLFILAASASNQSAYEMTKYSQGLLTYALLKAVKQDPSILEGNKELNVTRWFNAARNSVVDLAKETGARQQPQMIATTDFNVGVVDAEVMSKIVLPNEKPVFTNSNFQNNDENIAADNFGLNTIVDQQLYTFSVSTNASIAFIPGLSSPDTYNLSGRYTITSKLITLRVVMRKNNEAKARFEIKGSLDRLNELAMALVLEANKWIGPSEKK